MEKLIEILPILLTTVATAINSIILVSLNIRLFRLESDITTQKQSQEQLRK